MRILFLTRSFNSLAQRLLLDLRADGHEVSIELDIADSVTHEAISLFKPDVLIAPFLKRAIPESIWRRHLCLIVHPGPPGDRGPSSLDWALLEGRRRWGVTVVQAVQEMDAGPVWAHRLFDVPPEATKSSLYRLQVSEAASAAVREALALAARPGTVATALQQPPMPPPTPSAAPAPGLGWRPLMKQADRRIDWAHDDTAAVMRKLRSADGQPGVADELFGVPCLLFDGCAEPHPEACPGRPSGQGRFRSGDLIARRETAVLRATADGAVWIGHVRRADSVDALKLPTLMALQPEASRAAPLPDWPLPPGTPAAEAGWHEWRYELDSLRGVGTLHFPLYNGAIGTDACRRLCGALQHILQSPPAVLLLAGGPSYWCNGIHLGLIEAAESAADESWANIQAIDDLTLALINATGCWVVAALQGSAGAGGAFMALAADEVWARNGVLLNPHYKNMGNLYGSEYWTYLLPRRLQRRPGVAVADVMQHRLPVSAHRAKALGLVDEVIDGSPAHFLQQAHALAARRAADPLAAQRLQAKRERRAADEAHKPLAAYRAEELARMHRNFYGFDPSYHVARSNFMRRVPPAWTPLHLALHR